MPSQRLPFSKVPQFSSKDVAYATTDERLRPFYNYPVELTTFEQVFADKSEAPIDRELLAEQLAAQYRELGITDAPVDQIEALGSKHGFSVITAHQPSLVTGPLYFIYKICSAINLAKNLNEVYPDRTVVPVFITGGEDHDFEEINHLHLFGKTISWEQDQGGAVGKLPTASLGPVLEELDQLLGDRETAREIFAKIKQHYTKQATYGQATLAFVHDLFKSYGLVVVDMSRPAFKVAFSPLIKKEIFEQPSQALVEKAQEKLSALGFSAQAHARDINFFYLQDGRRDRIVKDEQTDSYQILGTDLSFTAEQLEQEIENHPERFSPNVVMRPLFQESIFPNLAYIGGGGELAYWLERKEQFAAFGVNFPMLIRRNSVVWVDKGSQKKLAKLDLSFADLLDETDIIIRQYVEERSDNELSLAEELKQLEQIFDSVATKAKEIDPTLSKAVQAEYTRQAKAIENFEGRLRRTEKQRFDTALNQIRGLKDKFFPNNGLQERYDNFLGIYLQEGASLLDRLVEELNPLEAGMLIIEA
ncbi:MAG: bacillithiol biosynthesis cysteine-adding enzyme BshC [Bacteroidota bacterium]